MKRYPEFTFDERKFSVYDPNKPGRLRPLRSKYYEEDHKPTICCMHVVIAHLIKNKVRDDEVKKILLEKLDVAYDMGKRMNEKLQKNRKRND